MSQNPQYQNASAVGHKVRAGLPPAILLIDAGNTLVKVGWVQTHGGPREASTMAVSHKDIGSLATWLEQLGALPVAAIGVSVAGDMVMQALDELVQQHHGLFIDWVGSQAKAAGVRNAYLEPQQLGADRWLAMIGLTQHSQCNGIPLMLASFGTATTIDTLVPCEDDRRSDIHWEFAGGLILPGPELMRASLATGTARLPQAQGQVVAFPDCTHQAISSGIAAAQAGAVLRQWQVVLQRFKTPPLVFCSGGAWAQMEIPVRELLAETQVAQGLVQNPIQWLASPVLDGLARLATLDTCPPGRWR